MKILEGNRCFTLREIAEEINIPYSTLYMKYKGNEERVAEGGVNKYPTPIRAGECNYWKESDIPYFIIARTDNWTKSGAKDKYKSSYQKLLDRVDELEEEIRELKRA